MKNIEINTAELIELLKNQFNKHSFLSVEYNTVYQAGKRIKKNNPFGDVTKLSKILCLSGTEYEKSVQNRLNKEGLNETFKSDPRKYGVHVENTPLIHYPEKNEYYFQMFYQSTLLALYFDSTGKEVQYSDIEPYLYGSGTSKKQSDSGLDADTQVKYINIKLSNILTLTFGGVTYQHKP